MGMRGTGRFETHSTTIKMVGWCKPISLVFFGDIHENSPMHAKEKWDEFKNKYKKAENTYFIGMGDYLDLLSASERTSMKHASLHESTESTQEKIYTNMVYEFGESISFMRGKLLCMLEGNHHLVFSDGTTTAMRLCSNLRAKYMGDCAVLRLTFQAQGNTSMSLYIGLHHGIGSGKTTGSMFNGLDQMANALEGCDIYAMGDNHKRGGVPIDRLRPTNAQNGNFNVKSRTCWLLRTGSFQLGYVKGEKSYVTDKMLQPSNLGAIKMEITPMRQRLGPRGNQEENLWFNIEVIV